MTTGWILRAVLAVFAGACCGCANNVGRIVIDSVDFVARDEIGQFVEASENSATIADWNGGGFFVVGIRTERSLVNLVRRKGLTVSVDGSLCSREDAAAILAIPSVYWNRRPICMILGDSLWEEDDRKGEGYLYYVVLYESWAERRRIPPPLRRGKQDRYASYSLGSSPEDVCLDLRIGTVGLRYYETKLRIPKEMFGGAKQKSQAEG